MASSPTSRPGRFSPGLAAAITAFVAWGLLPIYWKALQHVDALEILGHRIVWSCLILVVILTVRRRWPEVRQALSRPRTILALLASTTLIGVNWYTYIWAVTSGRVLQTSLGYYINPLVNVVLGYVFFRERLRTGQAVAVGLASVAVLNLAVGYGRFPWISLILAFTFGFYGLLRKAAPVEALPGLTVETALLTLPSLGYLFWLHGQGLGAVGHADTSTHLLLIGAGLVTSLPLLAFGYGARHLPLAMVGMLQYISPTCTFFLGVFAYRETFTTDHLITFICIWVALALFTADSLRAARRIRRLRVANS